MRIRMSPDGTEAVGVGGISTVISKYHQHLPALGVTIAKQDEPYDIEVIHAGMKKFTSSRGANVAALHGMYWTGETPIMPNAYYATNQRIVEAVMQSTAVTVPSDWVGQTIRREFSIEPYIVPHGVDVEEWQGGADGEYVLWAKNNNVGVCNNIALNTVARLMPDTLFVSTFGNNLPNIKTPNRPFTPDEMKVAVKNSSVYLATAQETFGILTLEAMAAGKPVVGFRHGFQPVIHGKTGYLVQPGDTEGLAKAIRMALENRDVLGANGREIAKRYTWEKACLAFIEALIASEDKRKKEKGISVIIPYYNKGPVLSEAIQSVMSQKTIEKIQIIVVDDASEDNQAKTICDTFPRDDVRYLRRPKRGGVAAARNTGINAANGAYIVCLDSDDRLDPHYIDTCYRKLAHSRDIGIVFTGLGLITEDGIVPQAWPNGFDFGLQTSGRNQVPTAAMFRREMFDRVGGFRPRYTRYGRLGYGSEDAAFWLQGTAIGYKAVQVSLDPLFHYRAGGSTSKQGYNEVKWYDFYPWETHGYPIGAPTRTGMISWPVHIYSPPIATVVIPVGEGHETYAADAIDSVMAQTNRKVETIVVWDSPEHIPPWYLTGYRGVRFITTPKPGSGAGIARNLGARRASAPFLIFLDADDMLMPRFVDESLRAWKMHHAIIYTDYIGEHEIVPDRNPEHIKGYESHDMLAGTVRNRNRLLEYDPERAVIQPQDDIYAWALVTTLLPKKWFNDIGGFRESLESWEDWDLHIRLAKAGYAYYHLSDYLLLYRKWTGERAYAGEDHWHEWDLPNRIG